MANIAYGDCKGGVQGNDDPQTRDDHYFGPFWETCCRGGRVVSLTNAKTLNPRCALAGLASNGFPVVQEPQLGTGTVHLALWKLLLLSPDE